MPRIIDEALKLSVDIIIPDPARCGYSSRPAGQRALRRMAAFSYPGDYVIPSDHGITCGSCRLLRKWQEDTFYLPPGPGAQSWYSRLSAQTLGIKKTKNGRNRGGDGDQRFYLSGPDMRARRASYPGRRRSDASDKRCRAPITSRTSGPLQNGIDRGLYTERAAGETFMFREQSIQRIGIMRGEIVGKVDSTSTQAF